MAGTESARSASNDRPARASLEPAGVIDAADAERRRIAPDPHDDAQQRPVSLAMSTVRPGPGRGAVRGRRTGTAAGPADLGVARRPWPTIEAVAYFVVAEALTNVAEHAHARQAEVTVTGLGDLLRVTVRDDGRDGATAEGGSGLRGLAQRVASVDGTLRIDSPPGGPTLIAVELPCKS